MALLNWKSLVSPPWELSPPGKHAGFLLPLVAKHFAALLVSDTPWWQKRSTASSFLAIYELGCSAFPSFYKHRHLQSRELAGHSPLSLAHLQCCSGSCGCPGFASFKDQKTVQTLLWLCGVRVPAVSYCFAHTLAAPQRCGAMCRVRLKGHEVLVSPQYVLRCSHASSMFSIKVTFTGIYCHTDTYFQPIFQAP